MEGVFARQRKSDWIVNTFDGMLMGLAGGRAKVAHGSCDLADVHGSLTHGHCNSAHAHCKCAQGRCNPAHGHCKPAHGYCNLAHGHCNAADGRCNSAHALCNAADGRCSLDEGVCTLRRLKRRRMHRPESGFFASFYQILRIVIQNGINYPKVGIGFILRDQEIYS